MINVTVDFYEQAYLLGRKPALPLREFEFWANKAITHINQHTFNRINEAVFARFNEQIKNCVCELAEFLYRNEGSSNKRSEGISGRSVTYIKGEEYRICQRWLGMTGLMYRGQNSDIKTASEGVVNKVNRLENMLDEHIGKTFISGVE